MEKRFYTFRGYSLKDAEQKDSLTPSMEDYLEMIYRLSLDEHEPYTRVLEIASALNVQPPSATKMVQRLAAEGLVEYEPYSIVRLTPLGKEIGEYLLRRHNTLERFLALIGVEDVLLDAEKIEHNISDEAMSGLGALLDFFDSSAECYAAWCAYLRDRIRS